MSIESKEDFAEFVCNVESLVEYKRPEAFGLAICTLDSNGSVLDAWYPQPNCDEHFGSAATFYNSVSNSISTTSAHTFHKAAYIRAKSFFSPFKGEGGHANMDCMHSLWAMWQKRRNKHPKTSILKVVFIYDLNEPPQTVEDAYLRLHLLSSRKVKPNEINLDGIFGQLPNNAWTSEGPISLADLPLRQMDARARLHPLHVYSVDKFPRMVDYVVPSGIRIADASRVRLGAYLAKGTTVMHEGFVNFNAGTMGESMVEGRISAGVVVGDKSDIGGGASIMGTLSGGGEEVISIGSECLLGANSGLGISLGNNCTIEAGLYLTAGTKVKSLRHDGMIKKASELSEYSNLLFYRDSQTGQVIARENTKAVELNDELHSN